MTAIVWFRATCACTTIPRCAAALDRHESVVPVFCLDDRLLHGRHRSGPRTQFLLECLRDLDGSLRERGGGLVIRHGPPERELATLAAEIGADELHVSADVSPFARRRGQHVSEVLGARHPRPSRRVRGGRRGRAAHPGRARPTQSSHPFTVPGRRSRAGTCSTRRARCRRCRRASRRDGSRRSGRSASSRSWWSRRGAGRPRAAQRLEAFLAHDVADYAANHDALAATAPRASRRTCTSAACRRGRSRSGCRRGAGPGRVPPPARAGATSTTTCCCTSRATRRSEFQERYRGRIGWSHAEARFRGLVRGPHRLPARGRRHAPATARGLDAQPRAARGRLVPHQGPRASTGAGASAGSCACWWTATRPTTTATGSGSPRSAPTPSRRSGASTTRPARWSATTPTGAYVRRYVPELRGRAGRVPAPSRGRCPRHVAARGAAA